MVIRTSYYTFMVFLVICCVPWRAAKTKSPVAAYGFQPNGESGFLVEYFSENNRN